MRLGLEGKIGIVIGVGINVHMSKEDGKDIDQSWVSLDEISEKTNDRNELIANVLNELFVLTKVFPVEGLRPINPILISWIN